MPSPLRSHPAPVKAVLIVGATATGKSSLAMRLAEHHPVELICADSRTVHRGLDIGTAKPPLADQQLVRHHLLDVVEPDGVLCAPEFADRAQRAVADITARGAVPVIVGGTELFATVATHHVAYATRVGDCSWIHDLPLPQVWERFEASGVSLPLRWSDRGVLERVWRSNRVARVGAHRYDTLVVIVDGDRDEWRRRVADRVDAMFDAGLEDEVAGLCAQLGCAPEDLNSIGYREWHGALGDPSQRVRVRDEVIANTFGYATRQRRWLAAVATAPGAVTVDGFDAAARAVDAHLAGESRHRKPVPVS